MAAYQDFRDFLAALTKQGELLVVDRKVNGNIKDDIPSSGKLFFKEAIVEEWQTYNFPELKYFKMPAGTNG